MSAGAAADALKAHLVDLQMPGGLEVVDSLLERLDHGAISPVEAMEQLLAAQVALTGVNDGYRRPCAPPVCPE